MEKESTPRTTGPAASFSGKFFLGTWGPKLRAGPWDSLACCCVQRQKETSSLLFAHACVQEPGFHGSLVFVVALVALSAFLDLCISSLVSAHVGARLQKSKCISDVQQRTRFGFAIEENQLESSHFQLPFQATTSKLNENPIHGKLKILVLGSTLHRRVSRMCLVVNSNHSFQPSFLSKTDRAIFPGFPEVF